MFQSFLQTTCLYILIWSLFTVFSYFAMLEFKSIWLTQLNFSELLLNVTNIPDTQELSNFVQLSWGTSIHYTSVLLLLLVLLSVWLRS